MIGYALQVHPEEADDAMDETEIVLKQYIAYFIEKSDEDSPS